jgi:hypothetical protein
MLKPVIAREHFASFTRFSNFGTTEAIPPRLRREVEVCADDPGDCFGHPLHMPSTHDNNQLRQGGRPTNDKKFQNCHFEGALQPLHEYHDIFRDREI